MTTKNKIDQIYLMDTQAPAKDTKLAKIEKYPIKTRIFKDPRFSFSKPKVAGTANILWKRN